MRKGWFAIAGVQDGDRTVEEQMLGLKPALEWAKGKTVLDLGSAEGAISKEFLLAGAVKVTGIELNYDMVRMADRLCMDMNARFIHASLKEWIDNHPDPEKFDVVLALSIAHKLHDPADLLNFACKSAKEVVVFRGPGKKDMFWDGWLKAKHRDTKCHVPTVFESHGFKEGETLESGRDEKVQYWWRK